MGNMSEIGIGSPEAGSMRLMKPPVTHARFSHQTSQGAQEPSYNSSLADQLLELLFNELSARCHGGEFGTKPSCLSPSGA